MAGVMACGVARTVGRAGWLLHRRVMLGARTAAALPLAMVKTVPSLARTMARMGLTVSVALARAVCPILARRTLPVSQRALLRMPLLTETAPMAASPSPGK